MAVKSRHGRTSIEHALPTRKGEAKGPDTLCQACQDPGLEDQNVGETCWACGGVLYLAPPKKRARPVAVAPKARLLA